MNDLWKLSAFEIAERVRSGAIGAVEVVNDSLRRIEALEPTIHAIATSTAERAMADAQRVDDLVAAGADPGPLAGVPIGIKDTLMVGGVRTTLGSPVFEHFFPETDETIVAAVRSAGAVIVGKTNVPELAFSSVGHNPLFPTTTNPWNPELTPGGSSSGSAAGVAAGEFPIALGADRAGSIRIPAAHCGVVGFKPTKGLIPDNGWGDPLTTSGPITRTVRDARLVFDTITRFDPADPDSVPPAALSRPDDPSRLRIAFVPGWADAPIEPVVRDVVADAVERAAGLLGWSIESVAAPWGDLWSEFIVLASVGMDLALLRARVDEVGHRMTPHVVSALRHEVTGAEVSAAYRARRQLCVQVATFFEQYDLLLCPTVSVAPFALHMQGPEKIDGRIVDPLRWIPFTFPFNLSGNPAVSLPAGFSDDGLPIGIQLVGGRYCDHMLLTAAEQYESAVPWAHYWPALTGATA